MLAVIGALLLGSAAYAHPQLKAASPAPGSAVSAPSMILGIAFSEGIVFTFSGADMTDAEGETNGKYSFEIKS
jgi:methionine-rich copper-binding protein CopC